jgi:hypothetical protein
VLKTRIGLLLVLPLLWLAPLLGGFGQIHNAPGAEYSDLTITHWPGAEFLRQSLIQYGEIPMWNPHTLGGTPFAADPLSGIYYPPLWLALVISPPLAFNILFLLHLAFAGVGVFLLARDEGASTAGGLLAGIAFGGLPKLVAHTAAGHLTLVLAVSWTPWLLLAARRAARNGSLRAWSLAGVMTGIIFLADPRWAFPSALAALGYAIVSAGGNLAQEPARIRIIFWAKNFLLFGAFAAAVSAVLALPMTQFVALSTRANLSGAEAAIQSLPFLSLLGLIFGGMGSSVEWVVYPGVVVLALALFACSHIVFRPPSSDKGLEKVKGDAGVFWIILLLLAVFLSLGSNIPGFSAVIGAIPGAGLLRVPPRWMFLAGLALAMLAARGMTLLESEADQGGGLKKIGFALASGGAVFAIASWVMRLPPALWQDGLIWGAAGVILFAGSRSRRWAPRAGTALICLAILDLAVADFRLIDPHPAMVEPPGVEAALSFLQKNTAGYRVYSPSYSIPALDFVNGDLRSLDGVDPLMLLSTANAVSTAAGVSRPGYSVTLPAFATGSPAIDNQDAIPDLRLLGLLNVRYIVSAFAIPDAALNLREKAAGIFLYENPMAMPRTWVAETLDGWDRPIGNRVARVESESPNRLRLTAEGPGWLILAEAAYPAWRATVDGKSVEVRTAGGWWRAVELGPGTHEIQMSYDPGLPLIGAAVTFFALLVFFGVWRWAK